MRVGLLEVLRREVDVHVAGQTTALPHDRRLEQVADLGVFGGAGDPADVLVELPVGSGHRVLGNCARALAGEITDHSAPGLVIIVELINRGNSESHGRNERQARREDSEHDLLGHGHPDDQCREDHHQKQKEPGSLRFEHSDLLAGRWPVGGWFVQPGGAIPAHCRMITCANVRDVTLSSPASTSKVLPARVQRWRWDLNPRRGCPLTRFRGVRPRPLGDSTVGELTRTGAGRGGASRRAACGRRRTRAAPLRTPRPGRRR